MLSKPTKSYGLVSLSADFPKNNQNQKEKPDHSLPAKSATIQSFKVFVKITVIIFLSLKPEMSELSQLFSNAERNIRDCHTAEKNTKCLSPCKHTTAAEFLSSNH